MSPNYARFTVLLITASQVGLIYNSYNINRQSASISSAFPYSLPCSDFSHSEHYAERNQNFSRHTATLIKALRQPYSRRTPRPLKLLGNCDFIYVSKV